MKILHLNVQKKWYDMIESGQKREEYREIKPYWFMRLIFEPKKVLHYFGVTQKDKSTINQYVVERILFHTMKMFAFKPFDVIEIKNGYGKNARTVNFKCGGIEIGYPKKGLCDDEWLSKKFFIIKLGEKL